MAHCSFWGDDLAPASQVDGKDLVRGLVAGPQTASVPALRIA